MADKLRIVNRALQRIGAKRLTSLTETTKERLAVDAAYDDVVEQELMTNFWTFALKRTKLSRDLTLRAESATVSAGGTGYVVGEILTATGGTFDQAAQFRVDAVSSGVVTAVSLQPIRGSYSVAPSNPVSTTASAGGIGCTLTITFDEGPLFGRSYQYTTPSDYLRHAPRDPHERAMFAELLTEGNKLLTDSGTTLDLRYVSDLSVLPAGFTDKEELFHPLFANAVSMRLAAEIAEELVGSSAKLDRVESAYVKFVSDARRIDAIENGPIEPEVDEFVAVRQTNSVDPALRKYS